MSSAQTIAQGLELGNRHGDHWMACCPAHDDRVPSLSIINTDEGKVLVHCHGGCDQSQVIKALSALGLWHSQARRRSERPSNSRRKSGDKANRLKECALSIWRSATPADETLVETYLGKRGITVTPPTSLRFHPRLKHPQGDFWPAMIALVTRGLDGEPMAIHRTYLSYDGTGKAPVVPARMMLGSCRGGVVRLAEPADILMVGEGIETCLSAMQVKRYPAWAALSTSGLKALRLPPSVGDIIVLADGDEQGVSAAEFSGLRWLRQRRRVRIARPPEGMDFNDLLLGRGC